MPKLLRTWTHIQRSYWPLIKFRQTALLTLTGMAGFASAFPPFNGWRSLAGLTGSLFLAVSGCTVLNMCFDRDIDARMPRTSLRPIAAGQVNLTTGAVAGGMLLGLGLAWALALSSLFALLVLTGSFIDVVVYTLWLKRHTAWSILPGGLAGAMPILAGRSLASSGVDTSGLLLGLAILAWIPAHNIVLSILFADDYMQACLPTFNNLYGSVAARRMLAVSCLLTTLTMTAVFIQMGAPLVFVVMLVLTGCGLLALALAAWMQPAVGATQRLYKFSSLYILGCMLLLALSALT